MPLRRRRLAACSIRINCALETLSITARLGAAYTTLGDSNGGDHRVERSVAANTSATSDEQLSRGDSGGGGGGDGGGGGGGEVEEAQHEQLDRLVAALASFSVASTRRFLNVTSAPLQFVVTGDSIVSGKRQRPSRSLNLQAPGKIVDALRGVVADAQYVIEALGHLHVQMRAFTLRPMISLNKKARVPSASSSTPPRFSSSTTQNG